MLKELSAALMPLIKDLYTGLSRFGLGMAGLPYPEDETQP
jgi:hypothetical protein